MARILMVEDNDPVATVFAEVLTKAGHDVDHSITPQSAAHRITRNEYDLVLMDLGLPGYDGDELAAGLRDLGYTGPIVIVTGGLLTTDAGFMSRAKVAGILRKPIHPNDLVAEVAKYLGGGG